jgi:hypothetical protein
MNGQFTRLTFNKADGQPGVEQQVRLVSVQMSRSKAEALFNAELESDPDTQGLFQIQAIES